MSYTVVLTDIPKYPSSQQLPDRCAHLPLLCSSAGRQLKLTCMTGLTWVSSSTEAPFKMMVQPSSRGHPLKYISVREPRFRVESAFSTALAVMLPLLLSLPDLRQHKTHKVQADHATLGLGLPLRNGCDRSK